MKYPIHPLFTLAVASGFTLTAFAQADVVTSGLTTELPTVTAIETQHDTGPRHELDIQVRTLADSHRQLAQASADLARQETELEVQNRTVVGGPGTGVRLERIVKRVSSGSAQPLIVASTATDASKLGEMREDLQVMNKLIDDAVAGESEGGGRHAMGINVSSIFSSDMGARTLYVEGHGAIFQATVRFPLKAPEKSEATEAKPAPKHSPWEDARRELYGGKEETDVFVAGPPDGKPEEYSEERVESLKKALVKALGSASNFRQLGRDETITVVVRSGGSQRSGHSREIQQIMGNLNIVSLGESAGAPSSKPTMTLRVKKADADALSEGKINEEEFAKRTIVAIY